MLLTRAVNRSGVTFRSIMSISSIAFPSFLSQRLKWSISACPYEKKPSVFPQGHFRKRMLLSGSLDPRINSDAWAKPLDQLGSLSILHPSNCLPQPPQTRSQGSGLRPRRGLSNALHSGHLSSEVGVGAFCSSFMVFSLSKVVATYQIKTACVIGKGRPGPWTDFPPILRTSWRVCCK